MGRDTSVMENHILMGASSFWGNDITTPKMRKAIKEWFTLYFQRDVTKEEDPCQRIPYSIISKISKTVFSEYDASIMDEATNPKSMWQAKNLSALGNIKKEALQWSGIGGECLIKPILGPVHFTFRVIRRDMYVVLGRDPSGKLTGVGTVEFCSYNGMFYALLEKRTLDANGWLTIQYRLCQSKDDNYLGVPVALSTVPYFAHLPSSYTYPKPMDSVGLIQMRMPMVNCVDGSSDAVSVYAPAVTLIHNINRNERQLDSEFENSQNRIVASRDLIKYDAFGGASIPANLFIGLDDDPGKVGLKVFNPTMRDESYERRRQGYFRSTETVIGFKRGIISEVEAVERSATEITSSAGDYNLSIIDFQNVWYDTTQETLRVCDALGQMYSLTDNTSLWNRDQLAMGWGNGILYDSKSEWEENKEMVAARLLKAEIAVAWKYNLPWETPEDLQRVREKYMPDVEELTRGLY